MLWEVTLRRPPQSFDPLPALSLHRPTALQNATQPTEKWVVQEGGLVVVLPAKLTEGQIREVLKPYSAYKVDCGCVQCVGE